MNSKKNIPSRNVLSTLILLLIFHCYCQKSYGMEAVLLDTRTAISDLGWSMPTGSQWQEMTSSDSSGNQHRMLMVCQIQTPNQNNWMRSQYIDVDGARRLFVEIEFTIRSCDDVPYVATCKETFNLYYYESDRDEATSTFPPWNDEAFTKVDTIAADQRFDPGSKKTNFEIRDIGPITKKGIYLAVQDSGACIAFMHVRVYYMYCPEEIQNLAIFPRTTSGGEVTSLIETRGTCVPFSIENPGNQASLYCNGKGNWAVPSGSCLCEAGYNPNFALTKCEACPAGYFKSTRSNEACKKCPDYSLSHHRGATVCQCMEDYYRSPLDDPALPCSKPPSQPRDLYSQINGSSVKLSWNQPLTTGERTDISYSVHCQKCQSGFASCVNCGNFLQYKPARVGLTIHQVEINRLNNFVNYMFEVCARNRVSDIATSSGVGLHNCAAINIKTSQSDVSIAGIDVRVSQVGFNFIVISWMPPIDAGDTISEYVISVRKVRVVASDNVIDEEVIHKRTLSLKMTLDDLKPSSLYEIKVRAVFSNKLGPYSAPVRVRTTNRSLTSSTDVQFHPTLPQDVSQFNIIWPILGGLLLVICSIAVMFICKRRRRPKRLLHHDLEKNVLFLSKTSTLQNSNAYKTYVDPSAYENRYKTMIEFTKEVHRECVYPEQLLIGGEVSEVFQGKLRLPERSDFQVAIKTLKNGCGPESRHDFLNEASIMGQFDHPNVIRLEGVVTKTLPLMIITEYMENRSLDHFLKIKKTMLSAFELVEMLRDIAAGMEYIADMGYVHRDLAARNILVSQHSVCKVSDFGLSRKLDEDTEAAFSPRGEKVPLRWTAPESITFRKFTTASDVWSFGIVMWEVMSFGEVPYWDMSNQAVLDAVEAGNRLPAPVCCPEVIHNVMLDCWKKDRYQRPKFDLLLSKLNEILQEPTRLEIANVIEQKEANSAQRFVCSPFDLTTELRNYSHRRSTLLGATDSGINEDTDEECAMLMEFDSPRSFSDQGLEITSLEMLLERLELNQCYDNFVRNGCTSIEQMYQLNSSDLVRMGILCESHQNMLLNSIQNLSLFTRLHKSSNSIDQSEVDL